MPAPPPFRDAPPGDARDAAYRVLSRHAEDFPDLLPLDIDEGALSGRDCALARTILGEGVGRWRTLATVIEQISGRPIEALEPRMRAVLIGGAAQLILMDRVPAHGVIDRSVGWAKSSIRAKAGGMVNAILRKIARATDGPSAVGEPVSGDAIPLSDGRSRVVRGVSWPTDHAERLGALYSLPTDTIRRWEEEHPDAFADLAAHSIVRAPAIIHGIDPDAAARIDALAPHDESGFFVFEGSRAELARLLGTHDGARVQDPSSAGVVDQIPGHEPGVIVDLCAGQGTKTRQLLERFPDARVLACEVDDDRLATLRRVFGGEPRVRVLHADETERELSGGADLVLTDVPCSNSGVLARRREARYRARDHHLDRLVELQRAILRRATGLLSARGVLAYSTCSIESRENGEQVRWASDALGLTIAHEHSRLPRGLPGEPSNGYRDGAYCGVCVPGA